MDLLRHPDVVAAARSREAAQKALEAAETAYILAVYKAAGSVSAAAAALGMSTRTVLRRLSAAGVRARDIRGDR